MRYIKFRAWNKEKQTMVYSNEDDESDWWDGVNANSVDVLNNILKGGNLIFMEYIGLKDINGRKIYERDIIDIHQTVNGCNLFEVVWDKIGWSARYVQNEASGRLYEYDLEELFDVNYEDQYPYEVTIEVVGNIYENPELLEV